MSVRSPHGEDGSALIMVLAFVLVTSVIIGALLDRSYTVFRSARVSEVLGQRVLAANGGIDWGIQQLRRGVAVDGAPACVSPVDGVQTLPNDLVINGRTLTVECEVQSGAAIGAGGWSVFTTSQVLGSIVAYAGTDRDKVIAGPVRNGSTFGRSGLSYLRIVDGDLWTCGGTPDAAIVQPPVAPYAGRTDCAGQSQPESPIPFGNLTDDALRTETPQPADGDGGTGCRVFSPGRYVGPGLDLLARSETGPAGNYLESGVYYLDGLGTVNLSDVVVVGGVPAERDEAFNAARADSGCADRFQSPEDTGGHYGVVLVLGGSTRIEIGSGATVELFNYVEPALGSAGGLSVFQLRNEWPGAGSTVGTSAIVDDNRILATIPGSDADVVVHGTVYTPAARVSAFGTTDSRVSFLGGVVATGIDLQAGAHEPGTNVSNLAGPGGRTIRLRATTNSVDGEKEVGAEAVLTIANDASRTIAVTSWTVLQ